MSTHTFNQVFRGQQKKLVKSSMKKGFINAVHKNSNTVDLAFAENLQTIIKNVPVASSVDLSNVKIGQRCKVDLFDEVNPNDCVVGYVY